MSNYPYNTAAQYGDSESQRLDNQQRSTVTRAGRIPAQTPNPYHWNTPGLYPANDNSTMFANHAPSTFHDAGSQFNTIGRGAAIPMSPHPSPIQMVSQTLPSANNPGLHDTELDEYLNNSVAEIKGREATPAEKGLSSPGAMTSLGNLSPWPGVQGPNQGPLLPGTTGGVMDMILLSGMDRHSPDFPRVRDMVESILRRDQQPQVQSVLPTQTTKSQKRKRAAQGKGRKRKDTRRIKEEDDSEGEDGSEEPQTAQGPLHQKRGPYQLCTVEPLPPPIPKVVFTKVDPQKHTKEETARIIEENNRKSTELKRIRLEHNSIASRRSRNKKENRTRRLAEDLARARAERNYWRARALTLGAGPGEWDGLSAAETEDVVAEFRPDLGTMLLREDPFAQGQSSP